MSEKKNEDAGLIYVKPETVKHGETTNGYCSWGQDKTGKWWSINYYPLRKELKGIYNAEVRWDILPSNYDVYGIKS